MTVITTYQCDICFNPCGGAGAATITLAPVDETALARYKIVARSSGVSNPPLKKGEMEIGHFCKTCVDAIPAPPVPGAPTVEGRTCALNTKDCGYSGANHCNPACPGFTEEGA